MSWRLLRSESLLWLFCRYQLGNRRCLPQERLLVRSLPATSFQSTHLTEELSCSVFRYFPGPSVGFAELSSPLAAENAPRNTTLTPSSGADSGSGNVTAVVLPSGVFGDPDAAGNASTISGSPLSSTGPSSTAAPAAANDLQPAQSTKSSLATSGGKRLKRGYLGVAVAGLCVSAASLW